MHGAWCWDLLLPELASRGVAAHTMDLPGHGSRAGEAAGASLAAYAASVAEVIDSVPAPRVALVGHSMGGTTVSLAAALRPDRVAHVVYLSAQALADGDAPIDPVPAERAARYREAAERDGGVYRMSDDEIWSLWLSDMPRDDPRVQWALSMITPQPLLPMTEAAPLAQYYALDIPRTYIWPRDDRGNFRARMERSLHNLGPGTRYIEMGGDHDVMISRPSEVADVLVEATSGPGITRG
jgi:pimeloyl-ACP methyl ester carboxylesterase